MDDEKQVKPHPENDPPEKPSSITEGVSNLIGSIAVTVKDAASVITDHIKSPAEVSNRVETAVPPVEENLDARPMTADEIAENAAADVQPVAAAKRANRKKPAVAKKAALKKTTKRAAPQKANKRVAKAAKARTAKAPAKKSSKKTAKKAAPKKATKKTGKKTAKKKAAKKSSKKKKAKKSKR
jgi:hypothetical protein